MAGRINTAAVLNNSWNSGANDQVFTGPIAIHPEVERNYDFAMTSDPVLLQERQRAQNNLYDIFANSPFFEKYKGVKTLPDGSPMVDERTGLPVAVPTKIDRNDIVDVFYYHKAELEKRQSLGIAEIVMQICEFFEFNYDYVVNSVLSIPLQAKLMRDVVRNMGLKVQKVENPDYELF